VTVDDDYVEGPGFRWATGDARLGPPVNTGRSIFDDIDQ
jgi:hypothetical protein